MGDDGKDKGTKKRSVTPPPPLDSWDNLLERELSIEMKSFKDAPMDLQKQIETALRSQIKDKIWNKQERDYFKSKAESFKADKENLKRRNHELLSVGIARGQIETIEEEMSSNFDFPSKSEMISELKSDGKWEYTGKKASYHYVQFFYYVTKSGKPLADFLQNLLGSEVTLHEFCCLVGKLYSKTSHRIHEPDETISVEEITSGLRIYGINQSKLLECVEIINSIYHRPLRSTMSPVSNSSRISSVSNSSRISSVSNSSRISSVLTSVADQDRKTSQKQSSKILSKSSTSASIQGNLNNDTTKASYSSKLLTNKKK